MTREPFRFEITHPDQCDRGLVCGWDPRSGHFIEVVSRGACVFVCLLSDTDEHAAMRDVLQWMIEQGYFTVEDADDAICALDTRSLAQLPARLRVVALLIVRSKSALDLVR